MVHRPADSRLLTNLLQHEKEYSKQLAQLLDYSNASLASFAAYAAASPQPASQVILAVAGSLAAADDALRRYAASVDQWRETMGHLKDMEDEVGNVMRDREILVTRLIKASKSHKPAGQKRDSLLNSQPFASSSTLSLNGPESPSPSRPLSLTLGSSSKLAAAQQELQACEMHLVSKEHELATRRSTAVREGLGARIKAMIECGWAWGELGRESLRNLDALIPEHTAQRRTSSDTHTTSNPNANLTRQILGIAAAGGDAHSLSSLGPSQSASQTHDESQPQTNIALVIDPLSHPNPQPPTWSSLNPPSRPAAASRDPNELRPPSGASSVYLTPEAIEDESDNDICAPPEVQNNFPVQSTTTTTAITNGVPFPNPFSGTSSRPLSPEAQGESYKNVRLPAPYAIEGYVEIPVATPDTEDKGWEKPRRSRSSSPNKRSLGNGGGDTATPSVSALSGSGHGGGVSGSGSSTPQFGIASQTYSQDVQHSPKRHVLQRRITEEGSQDDDDRRRSLGKDTARQEEQDEGSHRQEEDHTEDSGKPGDGESTSGDDLDATVGGLEVVENPRFMSDARRKEVDAGTQRQVEAKESSDTHTLLQSDLPDADHGVKEQPSSMPKERKRFTFLGGHHGQSHSRTASQSSVPQTTASPAVSDVGLAFAPPGDSLLMRSAAMDIPHPVSSPLATAFPLDSRSAGTSSKTTSPSKRFLGSLRGFFGSKDKDRAHSISKGKDLQQASAIPRHDDEADASDSDSPSEDEHLHQRSALQNLFSHRSPTKKRNGSVLSAGSASGAGSKWETRTDRNIRELAKKGSVEGGLGSASGGQPPRGLAAEAVARAGVHLEEDEVVEAQPSRRPKKKRAESVDAVAGVVNDNKPEKNMMSRRTRTASDVGVGSKDGGAVGKRLKKVRNASAGGPPVAQSASTAVASWGAGVPPKKSYSTSADASVSGPTPAAKAPTPHPSGPSTTARATKSIAPTLSVQTPASNPAPHRSATAPAPRAKVVPPSTPGLALSFGRSPTSSSSKPVSTTAPKPADTRSSTKVDVPDNRRSFIEQHPLAIDSSDEEGGHTSVMIVDLGKNRRRAASELGHGGVSPVVAVGPSATQGVGMTRSGSGSGGGEVIKQRAAKGAFVPTPLPGFSRAAAVGVAGVSSSSIRGAPRAHDEYASDTAAFAPGAAVPTKRKKSLTKKVNSEGSSTTTAISAPSRKASVKSAHQKPVTVANASATVLLAEGRQPSGTLVASSNGAKGGQLQVSGGLSRNSSITANSSPGAGAHKRSNTLGQGMTGAIGGEVGKTGRKSSVDAAGPAITSNHAAIPVSTGPSLMNIVNGVTRGNRDGWTNPPSISPSTTANGTKNPPPAMVDVRAPARVGRETLATLDPVQIRNQLAQFQSTTSNLTVPPSAGAKISPTRGTGLVDVKAPASAFDEHYSTRQASMSNPDLHFASTSARRTANPSISTPRVAGMATDKNPGPSTPARRASVTAAIATPSSNGTASTSRAPRATSKLPLKSALRNPSPVPSSQTSTSPLPGPSRHLDPNQLHAPSPPQRQSARSPLQRDLPHPSTRRIAPSGTIGKGEDESDNDGASSTSYETGNEVFYSDDEVQEAQQAVVQSQPIHPSILLHSNGHAEHGSELSDSTVMGSTTQPQQVPRRRKSVRVSLQPTFSPSPPAIEDEAEEPTNRASSDRHHPQPLIAPVPVAAASARQNAVSELWADSSDEDEDYKKAKVALLRAAKKDREVKSLANRHP